MIYDRTLLIAFIFWMGYVILRRMSYKAKYGVWPRDTSGRKPPHYMESIDALRRELRERELREKEDSEKEDSRGA